jgi:hypothetical protein
VSLPFTHVVVIDGDPIKKFRSKKEAEWFTQNKSDAIILKLNVEKPVKVVFNTNDYEECLY